MSTSERPSDELRSSDTFLDCAVDRDTATETLAGKKRRRTFSTRFPDRELPFTERVWLPYWFVAWQLEQGAPYREGESERALPSYFETMVCAINGTAYAVQAEQQRFDHPPSGGQFEGESTPPFRLESAHALDHSRSLARRFLGGGGRRIRASHLSQIPTTVARWRYPVWVQTWERKPGRLDLRVLDGVTGEACESAVRRAVLDGILG